MRKLVIFLLFVVAAGAPGAHAGVDHVIDVANFAFSPNVVQAASGDTITWSWTSGTHTVTSSVGGSFDTGSRSSGTFVLPYTGGTVLYYCQFHATVDPLTLVCEGMCGAITDKTVPPSAPSIATPASMQTLGVATVRVSGTSDEGTTVRVHEQGSVIGSAVADSSGAWRMDVTFTNGSHSISADAIDVQGRVSALSATRTFTVRADSTPPTVTMDQQSPQVFTSSGSFSGTASDDVAVASVEVIFRDVTGRMSPVPAQCSCGGPFAKWSLTSNVPSGAFMVQARAVDTAGNEAFSSPIVMIKA